MSTLSGTALVLERVTGWPGLSVVSSCAANVRLAGATVSVPLGGGGGDETTVTESETNCGELESLSLMFIVAVSVPLTLDVALTEIAHTTCINNSEPQESVSAQSASLGPVN